MQNHNYFDDALLLINADIEDSYKFFNFWLTNNLPFVSLFFFKALS